MLSPEVQINVLLRWLGALWGGSIRGYVVVEARSLSARDSERHLPCQRHLTDPSHDGRYIGLAA